MKKDIIDRKLNNGLVYDVLKILCENKFYIFLYIIAWKLNYWILCQ